MLDEMRSNRVDAAVARPRGRPGRYRAGWPVAAAALAVCAFAAAGLVVTGRSRNRRRVMRASSGFAPAGNDLAWSAPAVLAGSPRWRFYSGRDPRRAVGNRIPLIVDGGMRRGTDILKVLMPGADAVFIGRAALYGVAAAGRSGAKRALDIMREELGRDLRLLGYASLDGLSVRLLVRVGPVRELPSGERH